MSLQNQNQTQTQSVQDLHNIKSNSAHIVSNNENLQNKLNLIEQGEKNRANTLNYRQNNSSEFSHIIEDNVVILNMLKQKQLHNKNNTKINKESQNQQYMRNNKNVSMLTADFGGSNCQSDDNNQSMRPMKQDQEKSLTQEDYNNLSQYLTIKNNFRTSQGQNTNKNDPQSNRGKISSNLDFKSINDDSFSSFDRKISATNGENTNNTNQTSTLRENLTNSKRIQYSTDDLKNNEHKISLNNDCMSHNTESRFQNQSSKQDTLKSTEDKDKKYSVSFSDNIGQGYMNTNENDNNTLSRRSEFDNNTLSKRSGNGLLSNETYKSNSNNKEDDKRYFNSYKADHGNKGNGSGNINGNGLYSNGGYNGFYNNAYSNSENVSSGKKVSINTNGAYANNNHNNQQTPDFNSSGKKISVNGGYQNNQAYENNKRKNSINEMKQNTEHNDKFSSFGNQDVNNRYEMIIDEDNKADVSNPADFFHTEYMKQRNLIHWSKVQNIKLVKDINSSNKQTTNQNN